MNRLYKTLKKVYRLGDKIFNSKDDALLYLQMNKTLNYKDLETIILYRTAQELSAHAHQASRTIMTIENSKGKNTYWMSYSAFGPPDAVDLELHILEETDSGEEKSKESSKEISAYRDFTLWQALIDTLLNKGYHVRDGISPFQLYEHIGEFFATKQELDEHMAQNAEHNTNYRVINLYPNALGDDSDIIVVEDVYAGNRVDRLNFIKQDAGTGKHQYFEHFVPYPKAPFSPKALINIGIEWNNCEIHPKPWGHTKKWLGFGLAGIEIVAASIFKASKNHHALITVTPVTPGSNHLFLYDGKFYTNFNDVFNRCKKDNRFLNDSVRVYEYSSEFSKTGAIKTYMYGDNAAECFAYCDENSYSRLGIDAEGNISSKEILDTSLDQIQQVFYYYMTKGLTPEDTTSRINKYFSEPGHCQKLSSLEKVLKP